MTVAEQRSKTEECLFCGHSEAHGAELKPTASERRWCCVDDAACSRRCKNNVLRGGLR